jgi:predicted RNA-binding Zn-ribbon protein involved in translation (DUF1610 family)
MTRPRAPSWRQLLSILPFVPIFYLALTFTPWVLVGLPLAMITAMWLERQIDRPMLIHLCPACGFDLRATTAANCPECGAKVIISASARCDSASAS